MYILTMDVISCMLDKLLALPGKTKEYLDGLIATFSTYMPVKHMFSEKDNRKRMMVLLALFIALMLPTAYAVSVVSVYVNPTSTSTVSADFSLQSGPGYASAKALNLVSVPSSPLVNGNTITVNTITGSGTVYLLNVLEIVNVSSSVTSHVHLYINGTLPSGVVMYFDNTTEMAFSGTSGGTYAIVQGTGTGNGTLTGAGTTAISSGAISITRAFTLYIAFVITTSSITSTLTGTLYFQFSIS